MKNAPLEMEILYEDSYLIAIDKPSGLLSVSTPGEKELTAYRLVSDYVKRQDRRNRIFVLHRLDRDTSGILMFAKDPQTQYDLQSCWEDAVTRRGYAAVVEGTPEPEEGEIRSYLAEDRAMVVRPSDERFGKLAITQYRTVKSSGGYSLLEISLLTGRKNQIRVQMAQQGHPLCGDKKYGAKSNPIGRLALHAYKLYFIHPVTGREIRLKSPYPKKFKLLF